MLFNRSAKINLSLLMGIKEMLIEQGIEQGSMNTKIIIIRRLIESGAYSIAHISELTDTTKYFVREVVKESNSVARLNLKGVVN